MSVLENLDCIYNMHQFFYEKGIDGKKLLQSHMYNRNNVNDEMNNLRFSEVHRHGLSLSLTAAVIFKTLKI